MTSPNRPPADAPELEPGPAGTKVLLSPAASRALKARGHGHSGLKVFPRPASTDEADTDAAEEDKPDVK